jgi:hypothetical protein
LEQRPAFAANYGGHQLAIRRGTRARKKIAKGFDYLHNKKSRAGRQTHR